MRVRLIRHATLQLEYAGRTLLVDPLLAEPGAYRSLTLGRTARGNPTAPLLCPVEELLAPDAVLLTHTHFDHFDQTAAERLPKSSMLFGQPTDRKHLEAKGFTHFQPVDTTTVWQGLQVTRIGGQHGQGLLGRLMGRVSGFVLRAANEPTVYLAGDTIWCEAVRVAIAQYQPDYIVVNSGAAQFNLGAPITMTSADVIRVCQAAPQAKIIAVHLEAINHCRLTRAHLQANLAEAGLARRVLIPQDGDYVGVVAA